MRHLDITLPTGFPVEGNWYRNATIRMPSWIEKEDFQDTFLGLSPAQRDIVLATQSLLRLGPLSPVDKETVCLLSVGDCDTILLHLRRLLYGNKVSAVIDCSNNECNERMDLEINIDNILVPDNENAKEIHEREMSIQKNMYKVKFRLPTMADLHFISDLSQKRQAKGSDQLMRRCILSIEGNGAKRKSVSILVHLKEKISECMSELDPQAEILYNLICPACSHQFSARFDIGDYLAKEISFELQEVYSDVHILASHYHWDEKDILNMTPSKRNIYLTFIENRIGYGTE